MKVLDYEGLKTFATKIKSLLDGKQNRLTAGDNISIDSNNKISATDTKYTHPSTHSADMITESTTKRFVSDTEKNTWNGKVSFDDFSGYMEYNNDNIVRLERYVGSISKSDLGLGSVENIGIKILTQSQYDALSSTEKNRTDKLYFIKG